MTKKLLLLFFLFFTALKSNAQQIDDALSKSSNNANLAVKAFNIGNLKYYARISKTALEEAMSNQEFKNCYNSFDLSQSMLIHLDTAIQNEDFATAQSHVIKAKELILEIFNEYNLCTIEDENTDSSINTNSSTDSELTELELQQEKLRKQQELLKKQEKELLLKLEEKKLKTAQLKKQTFITSNQSSLQQNVKSYNSSLSACDCNGNIPFESDNNLSEKDLQELKNFFIEEKVRLAEKYISLLNSCKTK